MAGALEGAQREAVGWNGVRVGTSNLCLTRYPGAGQGHDAVKICSRSVVRGSSNEREGTADRNSSWAAALMNGKVTSLPLPQKQVKRGRWSAELVAPPEKLELQDEIVPGHPNRAVD